MNLSELNKFINSIILLLGRREIYKSFSAYSRYPNLNTITQTYIQKYDTNSLLKENEYQSFFTGFYDIESLKITYTSYKRSFNIRRSKSVGNCNILVIPITLLEISIIADELEILHGQIILSVEFISLLKVSETIEDDIRYVKTINFFGKTLYQHLRIDGMQKCVITENGFSIYNIEKPRTKKYAKIPIYTRVETKGTVCIKPKKISFETFEFEKNDS